MKPTNHTNLSNYSPNNLLDVLRDKMQLKTDMELADRLLVGKALISKLRHHQVPVGAKVLIRMHEASGLSIRELRAHMGDVREHFDPAFATRNYREDRPRV